MNPLNAVRETTAWVMSQATHVSLDESAVVRQADVLAPKLKSPAFREWDTHHHYTDNSPLTAQYLLVLDALNFCFWPDSAWSYNALALALKRVLEADRKAFQAERLAHLSAETMRTWLGRDLPLMEERVRLLREVGEGLLEHFDGYAVNLIRAAEGSAARLVHLIAATFPGFRDHAIYRGRQVFFYKRAQIFAGDVWGAYGRKGLGAFHDIGDLTTFPDYRVPQVLRGLGILRYSPELARRVDALEEIPAGSEEETEIRAATVQAVERLCQALAERGHPIVPVELDWYLWRHGEAVQATLPPHHRTLTIYY